MTKLTLEILQLLDAIDRKGSFKAAAEALYKVPSALTYSVNKLEEDLSAKIFVKEGRRQVLTPAGRHLLEQGRELLEAAKRLEESTKLIHSGWESHLSIAVESILDTTFLYPLLESFYEIHPDIEITLMKEVMGGTWDALNSGRADLVIGALEAPASSAGYNYQHLFDIEWFFCVAADHPLVLVYQEQQTALRDDQIRQYRACVVRDSSLIAPPQTRRVLDRQAILRVSSGKEKIEAQKRGLAVGFLPKHLMTEEIENGELIVLPCEQPYPQTPAYIAKKNNNKGRALDWFYQEICKLEYRVFL